MDAAEIRKILFQSLQRELRKVTIDDLTVKMLLQGSGISRSTFYRYFPDKYELLNQCYQDLLDATCERYHEGMSWQESLEAMYQLIQSDVIFFQHAFASSDMHSLKNYILDYGQRFHFEHLRRCGVNVENWKIKTLVKGMIYGSTEIMIDWIMSGAKEPVEDIVRIFKEALPPCIAGYYQ